MPKTTKIAHSKARKPKARKLKARKPRPHPYCRPANDAGPAIRFTGRQWVPDKGKPGLLFISESPIDPDDGILWVADCTCDAKRLPCPVLRGLSDASDLGFVVMSIVRRPAVRI